LAKNPFHVFERKSRLQLLSLHKNPFYKCPIAIEEHSHPVQRFSGVRSHTPTLRSPIKRHANTHEKNSEDHQAEDHLFLGRSPGAGGLSSHGFVPTGLHTDSPNFGSLNVPRDESIPCS